MGDYATDIPSVDVPGSSIIMPLSISAQAGVHMDSYLHHRIILTFPAYLLHLRGHAKHDADQKIGQSRNPGDWTGQITVDEINPTVRSRRNPFPEQQVRK